MNSRLDHWEHIYTTKNEDEVSWTQYGPSTSLSLIKKHSASLDDSIIDIGGGDSHLVDHLLNAGFSNITVLDISQSAINRAQERLGDLAKQVEWICEDLTHFRPERSYDIWHDRAAFHFVTDRAGQDHYSHLLRNHVNERAIIATFSKQGPLKCSGLEIVQYDAKSIHTVCGDHYSLLEEFTEDHTTPFDSIQNFQFTVFSKNKSL